MSEQTFGKERDRAANICEAIKWAVKEGKTEEALGMLADQDFMNSRQIVAFIDYMSTEDRIDPNEVMAWQNLLIHYSTAIDDRSLSHEDARYIGHKITLVSLEAVFRTSPVPEPVIPEPTFLSSLTEDEQQSIKEKVASSSEFDWQSATFNIAMSKQEYIDTIENPKMRDVYRLAASNEMERAYERAVDIVDIDLRSRAMQIIDYHIFDYACNIILKKNKEYEFVQTYIVDRATSSKSRRQMQTALLPVVFDGAQELAAMGKFDQARHAIELSYMSPDIRYEMLTMLGLAVDGDEL